MCIASVGARALSKPTIATSSPHFRKIQVEYYRPTVRNEDVIPHYREQTTTFGGRWILSTVHLG